MKRGTLLLILIILTCSFILAQPSSNQTQESSQELYTQNAYGVFYIIIIAVILAIIILALILILPRIKEYT